MNNFEDQDFWVSQKSTQPTKTGSLEKLPSPICKLKLNKKISLQDRIEKKRLERQKPNLTASYFVKFPF